MPFTPRLDFLPEYTRESVAAELRRLAAVMGSGTVTKNTLKRHGRASYDTVLRLFGSLGAALQFAGLRPGRKMQATDEELLDILRAVWLRTQEEFGRSPQKDDLRRYAMPVSDDTISRRFGSWRKALLRAHRGIGEDDAVEAPAPEPIKTTARKTLSVRKRFFVLKRDNFTCRLCGASGVPLHVDHIVPVAKGGSDALTNLQAACVDCNLGKRDSFQ